MGRIEHGIDSLRILCTKSTKRSVELANILGNTNQKRQKIVDDVVIHARKIISKGDSNKVLILVDESYHEGVIGLAASRLVEEFYKPAIVISKGKTISKASARSIVGFNIIKAIRKLDNLLENGGGHPMAAGFSILTSNIDKFKKGFQKIADKLLTDEILAKKIKIDMKLNFKNINLELVDEISKLEPFGIGNYYPLFLTEKVLASDARIIGKDKKHLKLFLKSDEKYIDAIAFNKADYHSRLSKDKEVGIVYSIDRNIWDGREKLQLKVRDIIFSNQP
jgi:single-stranded-DNA-specific exonuclease